MDEDVEKAPLTQRAALCHDLAETLALICLVSSVQEKRGRQVRLSMCV